MSGVELLVALAIAVGLVGILVPVLPGSVLVLAAILVWAWDVGGATAWVVFGIAAAVLVAGGVVKYLVPNRRLKDAGIPASTQWIGAALGVVGFFVIPVVGLFLGFVLGVYLAEYHRLGAQGGLAVDQARAQGRRAQHPHRARRRAWSRPSSGSPGWSSRDGAAVAAGRRVVRARRTSTAAGSRSGSAPGPWPWPRRSAARWPPWSSRLLGRRAPVRRRPGLGAAGRARQRVRHGVPLPRPRRRPDGCRGAGVRRRRGVRAGRRGCADRRAARTVVWIGIALAFPAIWFVAREPSAGRRRRRRAASRFVDGALAGLGFGTLFVALSRVSEDAGLLPLALNQAAGGVVDRRRRHGPAAAVAAARAPRRPGAGQRRAGRRWPPGCSWSPAAAAT